MNNIHKDHHIIQEPFRGFIQGVGSGLSKLIIGHPMDSIKVRSQVHGHLGKFNGPLDCLIQTIKKEGFLALYKGSSPYIFGWGFIDACMVGTYKSTLKLLANQQNQKFSGDPIQVLSLPKVAFAGFTGGMVAGCVANPIDMLKSRLQINYAKFQFNNKALRSIISQIYRDHGILGFYRGLVPTLLFRANISIYFSSFVAYKKSGVFSTLLTQTPIPDPFENFICGGMAATTFWCFAFPFDLMKNRVFASTGNSTKTQSVFKVAESIFKTKGLRGFYQGFTPCLLRSFPTNGAAFLAIEAIGKYLP